MTETNDPTPPTHRRIRSFVVRAGRMTAGQERALRELWPTYGVDYHPGQLDLNRIFGRVAPRILEIGFGAGDALIAYAQLHPEHDCLGLEVHAPGVGHLLLKAHEHQLANIRAICHDAVEVLEHCMPTDSLDEIHIFFPDPWHKKRHHKRRLIQTPFVDLLARILKRGGIVKLATDWQHYAEQMLEVMSAHPAFANTALSDETVQRTSPQLSSASAITITDSHPKPPSGFTARAEHRPLTRFERRGHRLGHGVWDLAFVKK